LRKPPSPALPQQIKTMMTSLVMLVEGKKSGKKKGRGTGNKIRIKTTSNLIN
jgi:hypothetical protein